MGLWTRVFRFTALFLVLFTAGEMVTCEMPSSECSVVHALEKPSTENPSSDKHTPISDNDNCICCCAHLIVTPTLFLATPTPVIIYSAAVPFDLPSFPAIAIDRPPQLS